MRSTILTAILLLQVFISCNKDSIPDGRFIGTWIAEDKTDTLYFIDDQTFKQTAYDRVLHSYAYSYTEDSITIQYVRPNFVLVRPSTHHYTINTTILMIDLHKVNYGFAPIKKEYIKSNK